QALPLAHGAGGHRVDRLPHLGHPATQPGRRAALDPCRVVVRSPRVLTKSRRYGEITKRGVKLQSGDSSEKVPVDGAGTKEEGFAAGPNLPATRREASQCCSSKAAAASGASSMRRSSPG